MQHKSMQKNWKQVQSVFYFFI